MADTLNAGQAAVGAAAAQITNIPMNVQGFVLKALSTNAQPIYVASTSAGATATAGYELAPGEALPMELINPRARLWVFGPTATDRYCWASVKA
jgi:hypothetical protein